MAGLLLHLLLKNIFFSQKTEFYAQIEAQTSTKKQIETVRHYALKDQQIVGKGLCNDSATSFNLKCNKAFKKAITKNLRDIAHKRNFKRTSCVMEPSNPIHTLV